MLIKLVENVESTLSAAAEDVRVFGGRLLVAAFDLDLSVKDAH